MQKHYSIVHNYFSLLNNHINTITDFNVQADNWILNADDLYFEALTDSIFRKKLITFPQKIILIAQEISNLSNIYLKKLHLFSNHLETLMEIDITGNK